VTSVNASHLVKEVNSTSMEKQCVFGSVVYTDLYSYQLFTWCNLILAAMFDYLLSPI